MLAKVLAPALLLSVRNGILIGGADPTPLDLQRNARAVTTEPPSRSARRR